MVSVEQDEPCWPGTVLSFNIHQLNFQLSYRTEMFTNLPTTADEAMGAMSVPKIDRVIATPWKLGNSSLCHTVLEVRGQLDLSKVLWFVYA